jgi:hypothetical protein
MWIQGRYPALSRARDPAPHPLDGRQRRRRPGPAGSLDKSTEHIDSIIAVIMALGRAMVARRGRSPSYELFWVGRRSGQEADA